MKYLNRLKKLNIESKNSLRNREFLVVNIF